METQIQSSEQVVTVLHSKGSQEFAFLSFMRCVDFEKAYYCVPPGVLWEVLLENGLPGLCVNHLILGAR